MGRAALDCLAVAAHVGEKWFGRRSEAWLIMVCGYVWMDWEAGGCFRRDGVGLGVVGDGGIGEGLWE